MVNPRVKDESGGRYGRLMVICYAGQTGGKSNHARFMCMCDCGSQIIVTGTSLREGQTKSCGCLQKDRASESNKRHGLNGTPEQSSYYSMVYRCTNEDEPSYVNYGGRGITVCERWLEPNFVGLKNFVEDMGKRPEGTSLDRINPNGNYCPENCRWVGGDIQAFNTRRKKSNKTGRTGVHLEVTGFFCAKIGYQGKSLHLGSGYTFEEACKVREKAELKYYGFIKE